jgi:polyisoprenoid-binding protein YceI
MSLRRSVDYKVARAGAALLALIGIAVHAQTGIYDIDSSLARVEYSVTKVGFLEQRGRFGEVHGSLGVDTRAKTIDIELTIDTRSIDVGGNVMNAFVRAESLLDTARYPEIHFRSTHIDWKGESPTRVEGALTMHGVTKPVALELESFRCEGEGGATCRATATGTLLRSQFGVGAFAPVVSDEVTLHFELVAQRRA